VGVPSYGQTSQKFVSQTLALSNGAQTSLLELLGIEFDCTVTEFESLLDEGGELPDTTSLVSKDFLCVGSADDDFGSGRSYTDFAARVALFSEFAGKEFIEFGEEDSVGNELE